MTEPANNSIYLRLRRCIRAFWRDHHWAVIGSLALLAFVLGIWGFWKATRPESFNKFLNAFYLTLQLFILESGIVSPSENMNWQLQVARVLAPFALVLATVAALAALFAEKAEKFRLRFLNDHIIICGAGQKGLLLAKNFSDKSKVVVIEKEESNRLIEQCRDLGAYVLIGDATETEVLRKAKIEKARTLIALCGDDGTNAEIAAQAALALRVQKDGPFLNCFINISDSRLWCALREREVALKQGERIRVQYINIFECGARAILKKFPAFDEMRPELNTCLHILVVGLGALGENLVTQVARKWWDVYQETGNRLRITAIDHLAHLKIKSLHSQYTQLRNTCDLTALPISITSPEFHEGKFLLDSKGECDVTAVYVCLDNDASSLSAALTVFQRVRQKRPDIVVCTTRKAGLATLLHNEESLGGEYYNLQAFALLDETCKPDLLFFGINEILAREAHEEYLRTQEKLGKTMATNPSMVSWDLLPEGLKESNRRQVDHISEKLKAVHCGIAPLSDWRGESFEFREDEVKRLAMMEHKRWREERERQGWLRGPKDNINKTNPFLDEWDSLTEEVKEIDRATVRALPRFLKKAGFKIYRL